MGIPKYNYVEHPKFEQMGFRIADGKYENVIYTYGKVQPIEEDDKLRLKFEYNVHENPNNTKNIKEIENNLVSISYEEYEKYINKNK